MQKNEFFLWGRGRNRLPKRKRNVLVGLVVIQALICLFCFSRYQEEQTIFDFDAASFESEGIFLENFLDSQENGYYIDDSFESMEDFASTPKTNLKRGLYKITIHYQTNHFSNAYNITADNADFHERIGNFHRDLPQDQNIYITELWVSKELKNFEIEFEFDDGYFFVSRVEIRENRNWVIGVGILLLILFLLLDCLYLFYEKWKNKFADREWKNWLLAFILIILFASLPLFNPYLLNGHDILFHLLRIEGIREGIQSGQFPVRMQPNWLNGYGYGVSIFYGDILLYFPAVLRIFGCGVQSAFKWFVLVMNIVTAGIAYYCFKRIFHSTKLGLLGCMLHTTSIYRIFCVYVRSSIGEFCALTFMPLILVSVYEILWSEEKGKIPKDSWILGVIGFWGLITAHIISTELTAALVLVICLIYFKRTFRKEVLLEFVKMGIGILVTSMWFILPFIDMWMGEDYWVKRAENGFEVQTQGAFFAQLFNIFPYIEGEALSYSVIEGIGMKDELSMSIGGGLLAGMLLFVVYWINYGEKEDKRFRAGISLFVLGIALAVMTTMVFPWNNLQRMGGILEFMIKNIQFPWRLYGLLTLVFTVLTCLTVKLFAQVDKGKEEKAGFLIFIFAVISSGYLFSSMFHNNNTIYLHNAGDLDTYNIVGGEYMPARASDDLTLMANAQITASESVHLESIDRRYLHFRIECSNSEMQEAYINLPLLYYKGYRVKAEPETAGVTAVDNGHGFLRIILPENFAGVVEVDYDGAWYWRIAEMISLTGIIVLLILLIRTHFEKSLKINKQV